ncbi:MAG TPA: zinc ABC transporter substrate-binding protein, partial [Gaiellaceae bacterium]|nr:zinc ABC transporter substrate-binding protein [Gaiellaceae bacterium]
MLASVRGKLLPALGLLASVAVLTSGCGSTSTGSSASGGDVQVVAAESFWGSIAGQLGGDKVRLQSVISSPATDPHDFEPTAADARSLAGAQMVIENGIGYDPWAAKLVAANPAQGRVVLNVGELVGLEPGANPHRWYSPRDVRLVVDAIVRGFDKLRPQSSDYFAQQKAHFETSGLARYKRLLSTIRRK